MSQYDQLEPKAIWQVFGAMNAIPAARATRPRS